MMEQFKLCLQRYSAVFVLAIFVAPEG
jgi:hypothetical protein